MAGGDFDERACFDAPVSRHGERTAQTLDVSFYWNYSADYAARGPISAEEIAAREKRLAENKNNPAFAQRSSALMSGMSARNSCGPLDASACVTNGAVFMTNVWAELETNGTMTVTFDLIGGTNERIRKFVCGSELRDKGAHEENETRRDEAGDGTGRSF